MVSASASAATMTVRGHGRRKAAVTATGTTSPGTSAVAVQAGGLQATTSSSSPSSSSRSGTAVLVLDHHAGSVTATGTTSPGASAAAAVGGGKELPVDTIVTTGTGRDNWRPPLRGDFIGGTGDDFREASNRGGKEAVRLGQEVNNDALIDERGGRKEMVHGDVFEELVTDFIAWNHPLAILFQYSIQRHRICPDRILSDLDLPGIARCAGEAGLEPGWLFAQCHNSLRNFHGIQIPRGPAGCPFTG
jgi:hypothetical protein